MVKLTKTQIDELKNKGLITSVDSSEFLEGRSVDDLKIKKYITQVIPSDDIELSTTPAEHLIEPDFPLPEPDPEIPAPEPELGV